MKTCCVTGHRPKGFPWNYRDTECKSHQDYLISMATKIKELIDNGFTHFISGGAIGVDMDFAETVLLTKEMFAPNITLEIAVPCTDQHKLWCDEDKERYLHILERADKITYISETYTPSCMQKRNQYMVDHSDLVLAFWNGIEKGGTWNTICYARKSKVTTLLFNMSKA